MLTLVKRPITQTIKDLFKNWSLELGDITTRKKILNHIPKLCIEQETFLLLGRVQSLMSRLLSFWIFPVVDSNGRPLIPTFLL